MTQTLDAQLVSGIPVKILFEGLGASHAPDAWTTKFTIIEDGLPDREVYVMCQKEGKGPSNSQRRMDQDKQALADAGVDVLTVRFGDGWGFQPPDQSLVFA